VPVSKDQDHPNASSSQAASSDGQAAVADAQRAPSISLPKGGGAIRGIGEKFAANPVTGTGSLSVPLAVSPGRSGFGPRLSLSYDSGAGNGPFGFGWSLSLPSITRKTDKGLPRYRNAEESDVFILSGAEDLVPVLRADGTRLVDEASAPDYTIHPYRPRVEGLFARIERWTRRADGDVHWRSISKDNVLTVYGRSGNSRVADPHDLARVFSWLICETRDDKGNAVVYEYKREDGANVALTQAHERGRGDANSQQRGANRYIKKIRYGNRVPLLDAQGRRPLTVTEDALDNAGWMFEVVFDYGEGHYRGLDPDPAAPLDEQHSRVAASLDGTGTWPARQDSFSLYRAGFEVRSYRLCRRVLMFHHFPAELGTDDYLVRSTDFDYRESSAASFVTSVTQSGYVRRADGNYLKQSLPPLEFEYSQALIEADIRELDAESLMNLPAGLHAPAYRWVDFDGEGLSGVLTEQAGAWFYKPNLGGGQFGPLEVVTPRPSLADLSGGAQQLLDLSGDGQLDVVSFEGPAPGYYERTQDKDWEDFRPFASLPNIRWDDPNLRFIDLNGDGRADALITEEDVFTWYASLAEDGFSAALRVAPPPDAERGPRLVFADGAQSVHLADMSGDGLTDLVRVRNGEVCYWPNTGYGSFGAKVVMDDSPWLDHPDQFSQRRVRFADVDGSGTNDLIYLHPGGIRLYFNQSGNGWSGPRELGQLADVDDVSSVVAADLLGNGTACLVWSSPLPAHARRPVRYVDLMGGRKPHLLVGVANNLGAETRVRYAPSTKFYLEDKAEGRPWVTRLPFPVHVVERVESFDHVSRSLFVTRYKYHHGHFDGVEREFHGFGMLEQWDTEESAALVGSEDFPAGDNNDPASHVPPVHTKTWFHTGVYVGRGHVADFFAGQLDGRDRGEYYREPAWRDDDAEARRHLLDDTTLPPGLSPDEEREACRALKGAMLRREVYALDGSDKAEHPYTVTEQNYTVRLLQPRHDNRHAVYFTHARESLSYNYERDPADPRVGHTLTLEVDEFGGVLKEAAVGYGRRQADPVLPLPEDGARQTQTLVTYTEHLFTNALTNVGPAVYRTPSPAESRTYELTGYAPTDASGRFRSSDFVRPDPAAPGRLAHVFDKEIEYEQEPSGGRQRRLVEQARTLYRADLLDALLPLGAVERLALTGESYKLAFTPDLLAQVFRRGGQPLSPAPDAVLGTEGGYQRSQDLKAAGLFPPTDPDGRWWIPSGTVFHSPNPADSAVAELAFARGHFFLPHRYRDAFGQTTRIRFDAHDLLLVETRDPLDNRVFVGVLGADGEIDPARPGNDYRVLQPRLVNDINRNRGELMFDALGLVVGAVTKGKDDAVGDTLAGFEPNLTQAELDDFYDALDPHLAAPNLLRGVTSRVVYDLHRFRRTRQATPEDQRQWLPVYAATLARETHVSDPVPAGGLKIQISFSYSDGFGREIQQKSQAEPGPLVEGGPVVSPRWVGSGWTIFNNKGRPVRRYEPFFSQMPERRHSFEFGVKVGVSSVLFYDPLGRAVATLHPNHTFEKIVFDPWRQTTYDANDTVRLLPHTDVHIRGFFVNPDGTPRLPATEYLPTWHQLRTDPAHAPAANQRWPDPRTLDAERQAAEKTTVHEETPTVAHFDTLGRTFLVVAHNKFERERPDGTRETVEQRHATRTRLDIEGNQRAARDAVEQNGDTSGRLVMRYDYDMLGTRIRQASMEAGERWLLNDVVGNPFRTWTSRGHVLRTEYDPLRRPLRAFVAGADPADPNRELLVERLVYGEQHPQADSLNLRGKLYLHLDQAGLAGNDEHDFKGNLTRASRRLAREFKQVVEWDAADDALPVDALAQFDPAALSTALAPLLEPETFTSRTYHDALNRAIQIVPPHSDQPGARLNVVRHVYNDANLLERVHVWLDQPAEPASSLDPAATPPSPVGVDDIEYDAKGRRLRINYKNGSTTRYAYDPETFRLVHLYTRRGAAFDQDCDNPQQPPPLTIAAPDTPPRGRSCGLQNLHYTHDPAGNVMHIRDDAQQTVYFNGQVVAPHCDYTYDALYHLVRATGREHVGQAARPEYDWTDEFRTRLPHPHDAQAMRVYTELYEYDAAGNFDRLVHQAAGGSWTRSYVYDEASLLEPAKRSNRLSSTTVGNNPPEDYGYDEHGNTTLLPHLSLIEWDFRDQLRATARQVVNGGTPETTWYVYDAAGRRVRKVTESDAGVVREQRIYLGGFEVYRRGGAGPLTRETLHLTDDKQRFALVETRTAGDEPNVPTRLIRYQLGNHLGSAALVLDHQAQIISYEEYTPYGSTSYQAVRSQTETPKRYRYTGKEHDEESGFYYHGARYYAPWLGRWASADPQGMVDGPNLYVYGRDNPVVFTDPNGTNCDPTNSSCIDPTEPTEQEELAQQSFAEEHPEPAESAEQTAVGQGGGSGAGGEGRGGGGGVRTSSTSGPYTPADEYDPPTWWPPQSAGYSSVTTYDTWRRLAYLDQVHQAADEAVARVRAAKAAGDLVAAEKAAREVSALRNTLRTATQELLSPGGRVLSRAVEQPRDWATVFNKYGGTETFDTFENVARAAGRSSKSVTALATFGKYAGPLGTAAGVYVAGSEVYHAPEAERPRVAARESGGFVVGAVGSTAGTAGGTALGTIIVGALGISTGPGGWLILALGIGGGAAGGVGGSAIGREAADVVYQKVEETHNNTVRGIYNLYGVPMY
jgi:RHS repeat-associated protein